jgi:hypothetical protein
MAQELSGMTADQESINARYAFRTCSHSETEAVSAIALDAQKMARAAAQPLQAGETVKAQMRRAALNLKYPVGDWRIKAAWYGEAGSWGAALFRDFEDRFHAWKAKQEQRSGSNRDRAAAALAALRETLARDGSPVLSQQIEGIERALRSAGIEPLPVGGIARPSENHD